VPHDIVFSGAPFPHAHLDGARVEDAHEFDVRPIREAIVALDDRPVCGDPGRRRIVDEAHEVRVADAGFVARVVGAVHGDRDVELAKGDRAHVDVGRDDVAFVVAGQRDLAAPAPGVDGEGAAGPEPGARRGPGETPDAVAGHLGNAAVGVLQDHRAVCAVSPGGDGDQAVGADADVAVAEPPH